MCPNLFFKLINMNDYKPAHYNSVSPYFIVKGAQKFVDFLCQLFDASVKRRYDLPDGSIMHIEVQIDDSIIMISDATDNYPPNTFIMHVYVPDVDKVFKKAIALGCKVYDEPQVKEGDPDKRGTFIDFAGNMWSVSTQVK